MMGARLSPLVWLAPLVAVWLSGCGTTRWTDTRRTATEQMLISDAIDRAVSRIDFRLLAGKEIYLDTSFLGEAVDKEYLTSTLRQQMVSNGCVLKEKREQAAFIVEVRAGAIGTDRHDLLYGVPGFNLPTFSGPVPGAPALPNTFPEVALAKRTDQQAVAKIAVFAYHRETGAPVWQSGADVIASKARDLWVFGAGPFQRGTIFDHTRFAGDDFHVPLVDSNQAADGAPEPVRVSQQRLFNSPNIFPKKSPAALAAETPEPTTKLLPPPFVAESRSETSRSAAQSAAAPPSAAPPKMDASWEPMEVASPMNGGARK
jgi:hypothetical protein